MFLEALHAPPLNVPYQRPEEKQSKVEEAKDGNESAEGDLNHADEEICCTRTRCGKRVCLFVCFAAAQVSTRVCISAPNKKKLTTIGISTFAEQVGDQSGFGHALYSYPRAPSMSVHMCVAGLVVGLSCCAIPAGVHQAAFLELVSLFLVNASTTVEGALAKAGDVLGKMTGMGGERHELPCT